MPSAKLKSTAAARERNMTARAQPCASLSVKYQWPLAARVRLDTSPATQSSGKLRSSTLATLRLSSETERMRAEGSAKRGEEFGFMRFRGGHSVHRTGQTDLSRGRHLGKTNVF